MSNCVRLERCASPFTATVGLLLRSVEVPSRSHNLPPTVVRDIVSALGVVHLDDGVRFVCTNIDTFKAIALVCLSESKSKWSSGD